MNHHNDPLDRLLRSAARVSPANPETVPYGLEQRVLGAWRRYRPGETMPNLGIWYRTALAVGCGVAILSLLFNYPFQSSDEYQDLAGTNPVTYLTQIK